MTIGPNHMILEGIVTTELPDGMMHVAPMGPEVDELFVHWILKPYKSSTTFTNLLRTNRCIVHIVDDPMLIADAVLGQANGYSAKRLPDRGYLLTSACHWYALSVEEWDTESPRAIARCRVVDRGIERPFFGWNRAKHAVVEMAILASRIHILDRSFLNAEIERYQVWIEKTGGPHERRAFQILQNYIEQSARKTS